MLFGSKAGKNGWRKLQLASAVFGLTCLGCSPNGPARQAVSGQVTLDDKPVSGVRLVFVPTGSGQVGAAVDVENGAFELTPESGPTVGPYNIIVERIEPDLEEYEALRKANRMPFSKIQFHSRYGRSGTLAANVKAEQVNQYVFELKSR